MHPADEIRGVKSKLLSKKKIVLGITGSIAAVECVKLARELIRHGAEVIPVTTPCATKIVHPDAIEFATGKKPIMELTGKTEHVYFCGKVKDRVDLVLISPCTANTISKIAHGVDDTSVTTFATTAVGSKIPILIVPAMHLSMYDHKIVQKNIQICKKIGIDFVEPVIQGTKAKMANSYEIVDYSIRQICKNELKNKKVLIIGGATAESIDDVRIITNKSSGKTSYFLAKNAFYKGADVEVWSGWASKPIPNYIKSEKFENVNDLLNLLKKKDLKKFDIIIVCVAIADYIPKKQKGKIPSGKTKLLLELSPAPKLIAGLRKKAPNSKIVGFKVEENKKQLKEKAFNLLKKNKLDFVIANTISGFSNDENEIVIIDKKGKSISKKGTKEHLSTIILDAVK